MAKRVDVRTERVRAARGPRELQAAFSEVHKHGSKALKAGDYQGFADAVAQEKSLILEKHAAIQEQAAAIKEHRAILDGTRRRTPASRRRRSTPSKTMR